MTLLAFMLASALNGLGDVIDQPLTDQPGDKVAGKQIFHDREKGHCLLCHSLKQSDGLFQGNIAPELSDIGRRLTSGQLRLRIIDSTRINPQSIMPPYFRTEHLVQVARQFEAKTVLSAQEIEDLISYLETLQGPSQ